MSDPLDAPLPLVPAPTLLEELNLVQNTPISPANGIEIGNFFTQLDQNVSILDTTILGLQNKLREANTIKERQLSLKIQYIPLLSSIRRLPIEILVLVFRFHLEEQGQRTNPNQYLNLNLSPTLLTHVCRDWRTVALNSPELWSKIGIHVRSTSQVDCTNGSLMLFQMWITRSGVIPLDFNIEIDSRAAQTMESEWLCPKNEALLSIFMTQIQRWRKVSLLLPSDLYFLPTFKNSSFAAPLLESLEIGLTDDGDDLPDHICWLRDTPSLKALSIMGLGVSMQSISFDWSTPTTLYLEDFNPDVLFQVLEQSKSRVSKLTIDTSWMDNRNLPQEPSVFILSQLETLHFTGTSYCLLDRITAPALLTLRLWPGESFDSGVLLSFLDRAPLLQTLDLDSSSNLWFIPAIRTSTPIRTLRLAWFNFEWKTPLTFLRSALLSDGSTSSSLIPPSFPALETLVITMERSVTLDAVVHARDFFLSLARSIGTAKSLCPKLNRIQADLRANGEDNVCVDMLLSLKELGIPGLEITAVGLKML